MLVFSTFLFCKSVRLSLPLIDSNYNFLFAQNNDCTLIEAAIIPDKGTTAAV